MLVLDLGGQSGSLSPGPGAEEALSGALSPRIEHQRGSVLRGVTRGSVRGGKREGYVRGGSRTRSKNHGQMVTPLRGWGGVQFTGCLLFCFPSGEGVDSIAPNIDEETETKQESKITHGMIRRH